MVNIQNRLKVSYCNNWRINHNIIATSSHMKISQHAYSETSSQGRDDEAKMAAQLRVLPLRGQEIFKERMKTKDDKTRF